MKQLKGKNRLAMEESHRKLVIAKTISLHREGKIISLYTNHGESFLEHQNSTVSKPCRTQ